VALSLRDERGPKLPLQMPLYPEAAMPFEMRAGIENISGERMVPPRDVRIESGLLHTLVASARSK